MDSDGLDVQRLVGHHDTVLSPALDLSPRMKLHVPTAQHRLVPLLNQRSPGRKHNHPIDEAACSQVFEDKRREDGLARPRRGSDRRDLRSADPLNNTLQRAPLPLTRENPRVGHVDTARREVASRAPRGEILDHQWTAVPMGTEVCGMEGVDVNLLRATLAPASRS